VGSATIDAGRVPDSDGGSMPELSLSSGGVVNSSIELTERDREEWAACVGTGFLVGVRDRGPDGLGGRGGAGGGVADAVTVDGLFMSTATIGILLVSECPLTWGTSKVSVAIAVLGMGAVEGRLDVVD
jgi:hypothetical protein